MRLTVKVGKLREAGCQAGCGASTYATEFAQIENSPFGGERQLKRSRERGAAQLRAATIGRVKRSARCLIATKPVALR